MVSLTDIVDEQGLKYRDMYLDFIYELLKKIKSSALNFKARHQLTSMSLEFSRVNYATQPPLELLNCKKYLGEQAKRSTTTALQSTSFGHRDSLPLA